MWAGFRFSRFNLPHLSVIVHVLWGHSSFPGIQYLFFVRHLDKDWILVNLRKKTGIKLSDVFEPTLGDLYFQAWLPVCLCSSVVLIIHVDDYPRNALFWKSQTHSVNDSIHVYDFIWIFLEISVKNCIVGILLACHIIMVCICRFWVPEPSNVADIYWEWKIFLVFFIWLFCLLLWLYCDFQHTWISQLSCVWRRDFFHISP